MNTRPIKSSEWVTNNLKAQIAAGEWKAGDKLPSVVDLAAHFNVGRSTIREALSALKAVGMLDIRQGGGTYIKSEAPVLSEEMPADWMARADSLRHILEVRKVLETGSAALAARHRSEDQLGELRATLEEMESCLSDEQAGEQADIRFHLQIAEAAQNPVLSDLVRSLSQRLHDSMKDTRALWFYAERRSAERLLTEHTSIFEAIAARDEQQAGQRMEQHIAKVERVLYEKTNRSIEG
ncbi:FadR/GntR family transcriptional regulator [Paenibacillus mendelii]|uniref:FadR/GntR family transcriptional regulator n=1 Tax=Paenibacillus mendelii TaxID=206163 RepID=A0ABV6J9M3_9BACL|nr:FadR/GntR family transcriptional regulator [Paenibacillus mendelii]MCQ6561142.1 FadR family transcriptional regulator [Paenibacillus mendelii]